MRPINGRVLVRQLPYMPSKLIKAAGVTDKACENEGIVVALSPCRIAYKLKRDSKGRVVGQEATGATFPHEVNVGDRVIFPGKYLDDDVQFINGEKHRWIDGNEILGIVDADQPEFEHPITGEKIKETALLTH